MNMKSNRGFTLIELLVVIAIVGTLAAIVMTALDQSRAKGRDGARKSQLTEICKRLFISKSKEYYSVFGRRKLC